MLDDQVQHTVVHTGQNSDDGLNDVFFRELRVRAPDIQLGVKEPTFAAQIGEILKRIEPILLRVRPDRLLVLGDTNSGLCAIVARRLGIPVYHMEAGNRCYDDRVPEEVNRRIIDHSSTVLMPYTERSRANLLREGFAAERIFVTGNPILEVLEHHATAIDASDVLSRLHLADRQFFLVTMHRAENVDNEERLRALLEALQLLRKAFGLEVVCSLHPRTKSQIERLGIEAKHDGVRLVKPLGFFDFVRLEKSAACVLSDSGTVQEETCLLGVPNVTIREVTERPETIECGSNILAGTDPEMIRRSVAFVLTRRGQWSAPREYLAANVAQTVCRIVTGYRVPDLAEVQWQQEPRC